MNLFRFRPIFLLGGALLLPPSLVLAAPSSARPSADALAQARDALLRRGFSPGKAAKSETPELRRSVELFQQQMGMPATGRLDEGTLSALGVTKKGLDERVAGAAPALGNEDRLDLAHADGQMKEADKALKELDVGKKDVRERIEQKIESARSLLRQKNYHAGRERVMEAHRELDLARDSVEEKRTSDAREHLKKSRELLAKALAEKSDVIEVPFARPGGQGYLEETREARPGGEVHAEKEVTDEERAGAAKPKPKEECDHCNATSESGAWMKDATHTGTGSP